MFCDHFIGDIGRQLIRIESISKICPSVLKNTSGIVREEDK